MKSRVKRIGIIISFPVIFSFLLFNEYGIVRYFELKREVTNLNEQIQQTEERIQQLNSEIDSLKNSSYKIEKVARERYHMLQEKEQALSVEEK